MRTRINIVMFVGLMLAGTAAVSAQRWGLPSSTAPRVGVCFYEHAEFEGRSFCLAPSQSLSTMPDDMRDKSSSIRVMPRSQATVYIDDRFGGGSARFNSDVLNLEPEGWNDIISSLRVENDGLRWGGRGPQWGRSAMPRGATYTQVPEGFNDTISSIRRINNADVTIYLDSNFNGRSQRVTGDVPNLEGFWNDKMSSIRVF